MHVNINLDRDPIASFIRRTRGPNRAKISSTMCSYHNFETNWKNNGLQRSRCSPLEPKEMKIHNSIVYVETHVE